MNEKIDGGERLKVLQFNYLIWDITKKTLNMDDGGWRKGEWGDWLILDKNKRNRVIYYF